MSRKFTFGFFIRLDLNENIALGFFIFCKNQQIKLIPKLIEKLDIRLNLRKCWLYNKAV